MLKQETVVTLIAEITGNVADQEMVNIKRGQSFGSSGIEAGGRIELGTATTAKVLVKDATGKILHSNGAAVVATTDIDAIPNGVKGPLTVTVTEISNGDHTLTVYWNVKK